MGGRVVLSGEHAETRYVASRPVVRSKRFAVVSKGAATVDDSTWQQARLIPVSGINGADEQERRGTSALLAVLASVKEYGRVVTGSLGAPAGPIETFIEVPFVTSSGARACPDGLIRVTRGGRSFVALVEVKTGRNALAAAQLECYLDIARDNGFDAVLTVSNEIASAPGVHPCPVDKRKLRKVALHHLSWSQLHTLAVIEQVNRAVADADQAWILDEFVRYLEHPKSGAVDFDDMGSQWVTVRDGVAHGTLRAGDKAALDVATRFDQLVAFAAMRLSRQLGVTVQPALSRAELADPAMRRTLLASELASAGRLTGGLRIPHAIAPVELVVDLRASQVAASLSFPAPADGRQQTRVNWLVRQLKEAPDDVRVEAVTAWSRGDSAAALLKQLRDDPSLLVADPKRDIRSFTLTLSKPAGTKRGQGRGSFVGSVLDLVDAFYRDVVQVLRPWTPSAPKVKAPDATHDGAGIDDGAVPQLPVGELPVGVVMPAPRDASFEPALPSAAVDLAGSVEMSEP